MIASNADGWNSAFSPTLGGHGGEQVHVESDHRGAVGVEELAGGVGRVGPDDDLPSAFTAAGTSPRGRRRPTRTAHCGSGVLGVVPQAARLSPSARARARAGARRTAGRGRRDSGGGHQEYLQVGAGRGTDRSAARGSPGERTVKWSSGATVRGMTFVAPRTVRSRDPEVGGLDRGRRAGPCPCGGRDRPRLEDVGAIGDRQRTMGVCSTSRIVVPCLLISPMMSKICAISMGARPIEGSSSSREPRACHEGRPMVSICCSAAGEGARCHEPCAPGVEE